MAARLRKGATKRAAVDKGLVQKVEIRQLLAGKDVRGDERAERHWLACARDRVVEGEGVDHLWKQMSQNTKQKSDIDDPRQARQAATR